MQDSSKISMENHMADRRVIGLDIDNVVLDYFAGVIGYAAQRGVRIGCESWEVDTYSMAKAFPDLSDEAIMEIFRDFNGHASFGALSPYAGAVETILSIVDENPDVELVAITSAGTSETTRELRVANLARLPFSEINVIDIGMSKRAHLERLPPGSLYVDDLMHHVEMAHEVGLEAILYRQPYNDNAGWDRVADGWDDLRNQIAEWLHETRPSP
jgi:FMN phosphatase YigB (HAD superfamily)